MELAPFEVDRLHTAFGDEWIGPDYGTRDAQTQVVLIPSAVARAIQWDNPPADEVLFVRDEINHRPSAI